MLTGSKLKQGEGKLEEIDLEIGSRKSAQIKAMDPHGEEVILKPKMNLRKHLWI